MKKHIREMLQDLTGKHHKDFIPPVPQPPTDAPAVDLSAPPEPVLSGDLNNQDLSKNPLDTNPSVGLAGAAEPRA